jgi:hypothetical protein
MRITRAACIGAIVLAFLACAAAAAGPRSVLFDQSYDLCHAATLKAVRKAGGQPYRAGSFADHVCTWTRADLQAGASLSTHPPAVGAALMKSFLAQNGTQGIKAKRITVPGAQGAVLVTVPSQPGHTAKDLLAAYRLGTIQVNLTAPASVPQARLVALVRLMAR